MVDRTKSGFGIPVDILDQVEGKMCGWFWLVRMPGYGLSLNINLLMKPWVPLEVALGIDLNGTVLLFISSYMFWSF